MEILQVNENVTFSHTTFLLLGFPQFTRSRTLLIIPFLAVYVAILSGNSLLIYQIWVEKTLHSPMYMLISLLFIVNVSCTNTILPPFLLSLVFGYYWISLSSCLVQMSFIYLSVIIESAVLVMMALDRYIAILKPLHYHDIMTKHLLYQLVSIALVRGIILVCPIVISVSKVHFCGSNVIQSFACENMVLLNLGCGDISGVHIIALTIRIFVSALDSSLILISYLDILHATMKIVRGQALRKALYTCSTHLIVAMLCYTSGFLSSIVYRIGPAIPVNMQNLTSAIYFLFPAAVNPIIYGLRVKEIKNCMLRVYRRKKVHEPVQN
ncbi:olfactory receptor 52K1-like [Hyperolius riggenbachi]|uniref:olfactory receptor 52K1-like n=1 Tax=Hyperolius riggenbachi TaxID=752182 RepID=UPI0035A29FEF